jgi:hypothetical protein
MKKTSVNTLPEKVKEIKSIFGDRKEIRHYEIDTKDNRLYEAFQYMEKEGIVETYFEGYKVFIKRVKF